MMESIHKVQFIQGLSGEAKSPHHLFRKLHICKLLFFFCLFVFCTNNTVAENNNELKSSKPNKYKKKNKLLTHLFKFPK